MYHYHQVLSVLFSVMIGCRTPAYRAFLDSLEGEGGGRDAVVVDLPFVNGYSSRCVQGPGGLFSHSYDSTRFDIDLDTPNDRQDPVFAPVGGVVHVHNDLTSGFGIHANIDLYDGTYINLSHLSQVVVGTDEEVSAGQLIGYEGNTGNSTGDHVHMGRHSGAAYMDGGLGSSIEGLSLRVRDDLVGVKLVPVQELSCDLYRGDYVTSALNTPLSHPNGTLVKSPLRPEIYLLENGVKRWIVDEDIFWSYNYSFENVVSVSDEELDCYDRGEDVRSRSQIRVVYHEDQLHLLVGRQNDATRKRYEVPMKGWQGVLETWGIFLDDPSQAADSAIAAELDDYPDGGPAKFRDGSLLVGLHDSAVFRVSDGIAMPIVDWDTFLFLGFSGHHITVVEDAWIPSVMGRVGDCSTGIYCLSKSDASSCSVADFGQAGDNDDTGDDSDDSGSTPVDTSSDTGATETDTGTPAVDCRDRVLTWKMDSDLGDGEHLEYARDAELWVKEINRWADHPADQGSEHVDELSTTVHACTGDVFTVNGTFLNWDGVPQSSDGRWWFCADPWDPRYWGAFSVDGVTLTRQSGIEVFSVDVDGNGQPSPGDEVGCRLTIP